MRAVGLQVAAEKLTVAETSLGSLTYSAHSKDVSPLVSRILSILPIPGFSEKPGPGKPGFSEKIRGFPPGTWLFTYIFGYAYVFEGIASWHTATWIGDAAQRTWLGSACVY